MNSPLPAETKVVIVGGGIVGCSLAYHLTKLGWRDVVLLEQNALAGGTTWHAAGLVGRLRTTNVLTKINKYSAELYAGLEKETGHPIGWKQVGSLILGQSETRMTQLHRTAAIAEWFGVEVQIIGPDEAKAKWPLIRHDDILGAAWLPHDGKVIPRETAVALAKGAQSRGAKVIENVRVLEVLHRDGRAVGVRVADSKSEIRNPKSEIINAEFVVLTGGMWTRELALRCGVTIPLYPVEHHWVLTEPLEGAFDELPVGRDPDRCLYFRGEGNAVMLGAFQAESKPWMVDRVPENFSNQLLEPDWEKFAEPLAHGKHRIPALQKCGFQKFTNGPESFTPDNNFILGEAPELKNLFVGAGFNSVGIASAGGAGKLLAEWMLAGEPTLDLWSVDIRRFGPWSNNREFLRARVVEVLGLHYQPAWPNREPETARGVRCSPLHDRLAAAGACFGVKNGWERPNWFALPATHHALRTTESVISNQSSVNTPASVPVAEYSFGRQNWFANHAHEHRACRERVAVFDQTGFGKLLVQGRDAVNVLQRLCGNNVDVAVGRTVYTGMFNERGGFESDLTLVRIARDEFYLITGTAQPGRDADWIRRHLRPDEHATVTDVTGAWSVIGVMGPQSRTLLSRVTDANLSNDAFPFGTAQNIAVGWATVRAVRLTYVGELGWELHVPVEQAALAYDTLMRAGVEFGIANAGHYAINSLRLEKSFRAWGAELSPDDTALEAGLGFAVAWDKPAAFLGRDALLKQKQAGLKRMLVTFVLQDPQPVLWGAEPIYRDGVAVGYTTSGSYGHTVGGAIAMGYVNHAAGVNAEFIKAGRYEIGVNGKRFTATPHLRAPFDPERKRILS
ncbi:MAG: FAD-dependent oxidoreductase [Verrucomicrobia bacterium]|nr:FAD-dependent oxidoreductase [Verrucomicrobiota bacterium]